MDLHAWITRQVDAVEAVANAATTGPWRAETRRREWRGQVAVYPEVHPIAEIEPDGSGGVDTEDTAIHIVLHDPAAVLRRCETDRRILARHRLDPASTQSPTFATACEGCGHEWLQDECTPFVDNLNDCPELLDLAHAHGITDEILAGLDRPQAPEPKPRTGGRLGLADILATPPATTSDVPAALRGPRWKP